MGKTVKCARKRMGDAKMYWGNKGDMPNSARGGAGDIICTGHELEMLKCGGGGACQGDVGEC